MTVLSDCQKRLARPPMRQKTPGRANAFGGPRADQKPGVHRGEL